MSPKSKLFSLAALLAFSLTACKNDTTTAAAPAEMSGTPAPAPESASPLEKIKAEALQEGDTYGRVEHSLIKVQNEFNASEGKVPGQGKITLFVDDKMTFLLRNEVGSDVFESKVSLKDLNIEQGGMQLIPDKTADERPGVRILVQEGKPKVSITKNGKPHKEAAELTFYLADRGCVERALPSFLQAIQTAQGKI